MPKKLTKEIFIEKANTIHNNKFDYSNVIYINNSTKVKIVCPLHGEFEQTPNNHLNGKSCYECGIIKISKKNKLAQEEFIDMANKIHNFKFDYSNTNYLNSKTKIEIICPFHGSFIQSPSDHLSKCGCPKCGFKSMVELRRKKDEIHFELKAKRIHGNTYDYSNVEYKSATKKIKIICKKHGEFLQTPNIHLDGCGCPKCNESSGERKIRIFLENKQISFVQQKTFDECINTKTFKKLKFDFYLPEFNLCIEFDGRQHNQSVDKFGGEKELLNNIFKDNIKNKYCDGSKNKPSLIRISYTQFNEIESILKKYLFS